MSKKIRNLNANEIEVRVAQVMEKGVQLLLYKDSRCDKKILDETFGINGWKNRYEEIKGNLFCTISIWDETEKQWIDKSDCGVESFSEKEKGEASDAFKRACFNVGIGRELYTRIFYFAKVPTKKNEKGKYELVDKYMTFSVSEIKTNNETEKIEQIKIVDNKGQVVFSYGYPKEKVKKEDPIALEPITQESIQKIQIMLAKKEGLKESVYKQLKISSCKELSEKQVQSLIQNLRKKGL